MTLKEDLAVQKAALRVALKDAAHFHFRYKKERRRTHALGEAVNAAAAMLDAGEGDEARLVLVAAHRVHLNGMRDQVSHEPGGVAYAARAAETGGPAPKGGE